MGSIYRRKYQDRHGVIQESPIYWMKFYVNGKCVRESTDTPDRAEAKGILKRREGDGASGKIRVGSRRRATFAELVDLVVKDYQKNNLDTLRDLKIRINNHLLPFFGSVRAGLITTEHLDVYIVHRQDEGAANATINRELAVISRGYTLAARANWSITGPPITQLKEKGPRTGFFEREQLDSVLSHLRLQNRPLVSFAYITGWRVSEIRALQWRHVDSAAGTVRLDPAMTKGEDGREFPLIGPLRAVLEEQRRKADLLKQEGVITPWVFFNEEKGRRRGSKIGDFGRNWNRACEAAGVPARIFHDLRRTAVRNLVRSGVSETVAMEMTGHKTRSVFDRYDITSQADLDEAGRKLGAFLNRNPGTDTGTDRGFRVLQGKP